MSLSSTKPHAQKRVTVSESNVPFELVKSVSEGLLSFFQNSPSISVSSRHWCLTVLLLLDDSNSQIASVSLSKMGTISRLITCKNDPILLLIGLEWCRVLSSKCPIDFSSTANRQGLHSELSSNLKSELRLEMSDALKNWLNARLESMGRTVFSGEETDILQIYIELMSKELIKLTETVQTSSYCFSTIEGLIDELRNEPGRFTEYEWLGDPESCLSRRLLDYFISSPQSTDTTLSVDFEPICQAVYKALNRYDTLFNLALPLPRLTRATTTTPLDSLAILTRPLRIHVKYRQSTTLMICDPFSSVAWVVGMIEGGEEGRRVLMRGDGAGSTSERVHDTLSPTSKQDYIYILLYLYILLLLLY